MQKATISTDTDSGSGNMPLYLQLAGDVRQLIERGVFKIGDRLPSVRDLRRKYRVSAATAVQAYVWLERDGLVRSRERSGFYAAQPIAYPEPKTRRALVSPVGVGIGVQVLDLLRRINDRSLVAGPSRSEAVVRDGKPFGFKLYGMVPRTWLVKLGFENGDILLSVNGKNDSLSKMLLEMYSRLQRAEPVKVELERRGKISTFTFIVR